MVSPLLVGAAIWLSKKGGKGVRMINIVGMGDTLTQGWIGDNGSINQPTYDWEIIRVEKPPTKLMFQTAWGHIDGDTTKPKIKYGVVYYSAEDDGRRTYQYVNPDGSKGERNAKVLPYANEGYYLVHYVKDAKSYHNGVGMSDPYSGTGIKNWFILTPDNRNYSDNLDKAKDKAMEWFENKTDSKPTPPTNEPDDDTFPLNPPSLPDGGGMMPSLGMEAGTDDLVAITPVNAVVEDTTVVEDIVVIQPSILESRVGGTKTSLFGNRTGGF